MFAKKKDKKNQNLLIIISYDPTKSNHKSSTEKQKQKTILY